MPENALVAPSQIHPSAHVMDDFVDHGDLEIGSGAWIFGRDITIGQGVIIGDDVRIVGSNITIGNGTIIEDGAHIYSDTTIGMLAHIGQNAHLVNIHVPDCGQIASQQCYTYDSAVDMPSLN